MPQPQQLQYFYKKLAQFELHNVRVNVAESIIDCIEDHQNTKLLSENESVLMGILDLTCQIAHLAQAKTSLTINDIIKGAFIIAFEQYHANPKADVHETLGNTLNVHSASSLRERMLTAIDYEIPPPSQHIGNTLSNELLDLATEGAELEKSYSYLSNAEKLAQSFRKSDRFWSQNMQSRADVLEKSISVVRQFLPFYSTGATFSPDFSSLSKVAHFKSFNESPSIHEALNLPKSMPKMQSVDAIEQRPKPRV